MDADKPSLATAAPRIVRVDAAGEVMGESIWPTGHVAFDVVEAPSGVWLVGGKLEPNATQTLNPWWATTDAQGQPGPIAAPDVGFGGKDDRLVAAARLGQGIVAVGAIAHDPGRQALLMRIDVTGTLWKLSHGLTGQMTDARAVDVRDQTVYVAGWRRPGYAASIDRRGWLAAFAANGDLLWEHTFSRGGDDRLRALAVSPAGEVYAVGAHTSASSGSFPWIAPAPASKPTSYAATRQIRTAGGSAVALQSFSYNPLLASSYELSRLVWLDPATGKVAERDLPLELGGVDLRWRGAAPTGDALQTWVVGSQSTSAGATAVCALVTDTTTGTIHTVASTELAGANVTMLDAVRADDGGFFFAGQYDTPVSKGIWLGRVQPDGALLWEASSGTPGTTQGAGDRVAGVLRDAGALVVAGSYAPDGFKTLGWFGRYTFDGAELATASLGWANSPSPVITLAALAPLGPGFALVGAGHHQIGPDQGLVYRTDAWGHGSCALAGDCAALAAADCDDGDPQTADSCNPSGCQHSGP